MKLSAAYLAYELEKLYALTLPSPLSFQPYLELSPLTINPTNLYEGGIFFFQNQLPAFDNYPSNCLIFYQGEKDTRSHFLSKHFIGIDSSLSFLQLYSSIFSIFKKVDDWEQSLMKSRLNGEPIHHLLKLSLPIFQNSMLVMGLDFTVVSKLFVKESPFDESVFGSGKEIYPLLKTLKNSALYASLQDLDHFFFFPKEFIKQNCLCVNIKKFQKTGYRLFLLEDNLNLHPAFGFLLEFLADMVEHALSHNGVHSPDDKSINTIFKTLLTDKTADYMVISQRLSNYGWDSKDYYRCIALQTTPLEQENLTLKSTCQYLENILPHACVLPHHGFLLIYLNESLQTKEGLLEKSRQKLNNFAKSNHMKTGYSRCMQGHLNLRRQYIQASIAISMGSKKNPSSTIYSFNDISFDYILEQSTRILPGNMVCYQKLLTLKEWDEQNGSDYTQTLGCYLKNHLNAVQSAKDLNIHRSTFLYRLDKIKSILETSFDDTKEYLYLLLSFYLLDGEGLS